MVNYNLPPLLATKNFFIALTLFILGEKAPSGENIDTFLAPVVRDLKRLWEGVHYVDMSLPAGAQAFTLRAILLWVVHELPAYGLISGQQVKGYRGCPICTSATCAEHSTILRKMVYMGGRRYLEVGHPWRKAKAAFNGEGENRVAPPRTIAE
jgi:hypothetical protein